MTLIGLASPKKLSQKLKISSRNQTYLFASFASTIFLTSAATFHIGKSKPSKKCKPRMTPQVESFGLISLTSGVVKILEKILPDCFYYMAETNNLFSQFQAWFRKGQNCEDQITQIV